MGDRDKLVPLNFNGKPNQLQIQTWNQSIVVETLKWVSPEALTLFAFRGWDNVPKAISI